MSALALACSPSPYSENIHATLQTLKCSVCVHCLVFLVNNVGVCVISGGGIMWLACELSIMRMGPKWTSEF